MTENQHRLLQALRALGGKATLGDLVRVTALPPHEIERQILGALSHVGGNLLVDEHGHIVYSIERSRPLPSFRPSWPRRLLSLLYALFQAGFFAALTLCMLAYSAIYLSFFAVAALVVWLSAILGHDTGFDWDWTPNLFGGRDAQQHTSVWSEFNFFRAVQEFGEKLRAFIYKDDSRREVQRATRRRVQAEARAVRQEQKRQRARERAERLHAAAQRLGNLRGKTLDLPLELEEITANPPFFRALRGFIFGPIRPQQSEATERQNILGFVRDHNGRITATDAALLTGLTLDQADRLLLKAAAEQEGDIEVDADGAIVYRFDRLMVSATSELDVVPWLEERVDKLVTVAEFAEAFDLNTTDAEARLEWLAESSGGIRRAGPDAADFLFDADALEAIANTSAAHAALRSYHYVWERLEKGPAVIGVPPGKRGWIYGFNAVNLVASLALLLYYDTGDRLLAPHLGFLSPTAELWAFSYIPLFLSLGVFAIPLVRLVVITLQDRGRRQRNLERMMLLAVAHALLDDDYISAPEIRRNMRLDVVAEPTIQEHMDRLGRALDGAPAVNGGWHFPRMHRELRAVAVDDDVRPGAFSLRRIVYNTSSR